MLFDVCVETHNLGGTWEGGGGGHMLGEEGKGGCEEEM